MAKPLVIVESPAKAKTIASFLGPDFIVESSIGHIRDLPRSAAEIPPTYKGEAWARLGVDVENGFKPLYVVSKEKKSQVSKLKSLLKDASELYLATDEDREGESIAWHLLEVLAPRIPVRRMVFHEITRAAIDRAVAETRELDRRLVDAQETRRILDRLYGYEVSPVLWRKVMPRLSAGRVQSVATRVLVERERARMRFRSATWWRLEVDLHHDSQPFRATVASVDGTRLATGRDFDENGALAARGEAPLVLDEQVAVDLASRLEGETFEVTSVEEKPFRRSPYPPFMTSTLQQEAGRKLRFSSQRAMSVAQRLYEAGYITYMRTDSVELSESAVQAARAQAAALYGPDHVPAAPRTYRSKVRNAQEAHEAIRPAGETFRTPSEVRSELSADEARLYELIWKRTIASQMADATGTSATIKLSATARAGADGRAESVEAVATGRVVRFAGFLRAYVEGADDPEAQAEDAESHLPAVSEGDRFRSEGVSPSGHATQPPARYTEASLVKALEELGVGRPSTYASIIGTIQDRGYVWKKGSALVPSFVAFSVIGLLEQYFTSLVDYGFTASMEDALDLIAGGTEEAEPYLRRFYFGAGPGGESSNGSVGLRQAVSAHLDDIDAREVNSIRIGTDAEGRDVVVRVGRYGPYLQRGEDRAPIPEDLAPDEVTLERAAELLAAPSGDRILGEDPTTGLPVLLRAGRFGPYVQLGEADAASKTKPQTASLLSSMTPEMLTLDQALQLLTLPKTLGEDDSGEEVIVANGRFGPYVKRGADTRSLPSEEALFSIDLHEALALLAEPKPTRGRRPAAPPLKELGPDPVSGAPMVVKEGRFGPYVTDGETNASLKRGDDPASITPERGAELLADRRSAGPSKPRRTARGAKAAGGAKAKATKATKTTKAKTKSTATKAKSTATKATATKAKTSPTPPGTSDGG